MNKKLADMIKQQMHKEAKNDNGLSKAKNLLKEHVEKAKKIISQLSEYDVEKEAGTIRTVIEDLDIQLASISDLRKKISKEDK